MRGIFPAKIQINADIDERLRKINRIWNAKRRYDANRLNYASKTTMLQKTLNRLAKDRLLPAGLPSFATQNAVNYKSADKPPTVMKLAGVITCRLSSCPS